MTNLDIRHILSARMQYRNMVWAFLAVLIFVETAAAQSSTTTHPTDGSTPLGMAPGAPAGSYPLGGFDNVNLYNGNLNFALPLMQVGGRGEAGYTMMLGIDQRWEVRHDADISNCSPGGCTYTHRYYAMPTLWEPIRPGYGPGALIGRQSGRTILNCGSGYTRFTTTITRFTFMASDGTEYEFRDKLTGGQPLESGCNVSPGPSRGREFVTADGTSATFICDETIFDETGGNNKLFKSGYIKFRDGKVYRINQGLVDWIRDRNGNVVKFSYDAQKRVTTINDSLNRVITITYNNATQLYDLISFKGSAGVIRSIKVGGVNGIGEPTINSLRADYRSAGFKTYTQLFPSVLPSFNTTFSPLNPAFVELPDGRKYRLYYNAYGELARVELPTGGAFEYDWEGGPQADTTGILSGTGVSGFLEYNIYRRVVTKRTYPDGGSLFAGSAFESKIKFIKGINPNGTEAESIDVEVRDTGNSLVSKTTHYHYGAASASFTIAPTEYESAFSGKEYKTETFDGTNGSRVESTWVARVVRTWAEEDPRITDTITTLIETSQMSKQHFDYDANNNTTDTWEYDFGSAAPGALLRHRKTTYLNTTGYAGSGDDAPLLLSLATEEAIYNGADQINPKAKTTYEYDNYTAGLTDRSNICGHARTQLPSRFTASYTTRGNVTQITAWLLPSTSLSSRMQYDIAGNVTSSTDPLNRTTSFNFDDRYGSPDGNARNNIQSPAELGVQSTYAFNTLVTNAAGHTAYSQRDYYTGKVVDGEDVNAVVTSGYYNDSLDRPTQVIQGSQPASSLMAQTTFVYNDAARTVNVISDMSSLGDNILSSQILYDGIGRTIEKRNSTPDGTIVSKQVYDAMSRVTRNYNPTITPTESTYGWTDTTYDKLSRVKRVETFNQLGTSTGAVVTTYSGNQMTVTDQAGKQRRSVNDALGRSIQLVEDPAVLNYQTNYAYDAMDDLITVTQGSQTRSFVYDSLKRLKSATNPESGTVSYDYDANSNLWHKTDARGVVTTYAYDVLNRVTSRTYTIDASNTPQVNYYYDAQSLPAGAPATFARGASVGRLVAVLYGGATSSAGSYQGYDSFGRPTTSFQQTDSQNYQMSYSYNLAGRIISQSYPSGRVVQTDYDSAARIAGVKNQATGQYYVGAEANDNVNRLQYTSHGAISVMRLGNAKWEHTVFNNRLQLTEIGLGTSSNDSSILKLEYGYGSTNNNGNMLSHTITAPKTSGGSLVLTQGYSYDPLNRLQSASENTSSNWQQTFDCDRWGNHAVRNTSYIPSPLLTPQSATATDFSAFVQGTNRLSKTKYPNIVYDAAGNLTRDAVSSTFSYDAENRQVTSSVGGVSASYSYDGDGHRVKKVVQGSPIVTTVFVYNVANQLIAEYASDPVPPPAGQGGTSYLTSDTLASTRVVTNADGNVKARYDYLPYGEEIASSIGGRSGVSGYGGADSTKQKFTSKERDNESGLDYFMARYYSTAQGRFTSPDEVSCGPNEVFASGGCAPQQALPYADLMNPQSINKYQYCFNNPLRYVDPDGHQAGQNNTNQQDPERDVNLILPTPSVTGKIVTFILRLIGPAPPPPPPTPDPTPTPVPEPVPPPPPSQPQPQVPCPCRAQPTSGPFIHNNPLSLVGQPLVGSGECVALVQNTLNLPHTTLWRPGEYARGNTSITVGTALATFENGIFPVPNTPGRNHAVFYAGQDPQRGLFVVEQYHTLSRIQTRWLPWDDSRTPSNNGNRFYVIKACPCRR